MNLKEIFNIYFSIIIIIFIYNLQDKITLSDIQETKLIESNTFLFKTITKKFF